MCVLRAGILLLEESLIQGADDEAEERPSKRSRAAAPTVSRDTASWVELAK